MFSFWLLIGSIFAVLISNFLWWLFRKNPPTVFYPLARILNRKPKLKPVYQIRRPNLLHFLSFFLLSFLILWMLFKPHTVKYFSKPNVSNKILFIADFSASIQSSMSLPKYREYVAEVIQSTKNKVSDAQFFYLNTSHGGELLKLDSEDVLAEELSKSFFHPAASIWSRVLQRVSVDAVAQKFQKIVIITDFQKSSWDGVELENFERFYGVKLFVLRLPSITSLSSSDKLSVNYFIEDIAVSLDPIRKERNLEIDIGIWKSSLAETTDSQSYPSSLEVMQGKEKIFQHSFSIDPKSTNQKLRLRWPLSAEKKEIYSLNVEIKPGQEDLLLLDNQIVIPRTELVDEWLVLSPRAGENYMAEAWFHLQNAMESVSLNVSLRDASGKELKSQTLASMAGKSLPDKVLMIGGHHSEDFSFCSPKMGSSSVMVLFPAHLRADYKILCRCVAKQLGEESKENSWCQGVSDSESFSELLKSVGGKQQAGNLGESSKAIAWKFVAPVLSAGKSFLVFTLPPIPALYGGHVPFLRAMQFFLKTEGSLDGIKSFWKQDLDWFTEVLTHPDRLDFYRLTQRISRSESILDMQEISSDLGKSIFASPEEMLAHITFEASNPVDRALLDVHSPKVEDTSAIPYPDSFYYVWFLLVAVSLVWGLEILLRFLKIDEKPNSSKRETLKI